MQALKPRPRRVDCLPVGPAAGQLRRYERRRPHLCGVRSQLQKIADLSHSCTVEGWLCLPVLIDLFLRQWSGWSSSTEITVQIVTTPAMAIWRRGRPDALLHSADRSSQYTSGHFQKQMADRLSDEPLTQCPRNAAMESVFSLLETGLTVPKTTARLTRQN